MSEMHDDWLFKLGGAPLAVTDAFQKADTIINMPQYKPGRIACSVSGGADSDVMVDIITKVDTARKVRYMFFNTGVEYRATLEHLDEIERRYGIEIERLAPVKSIPACVRQYGQPVISKQVSQNVEQLQRKGFLWEDEDIGTLSARYPGCRAALMWWCNAYQDDDNGHKSHFNIARFKWLKEYMLANPPSFRVADKCCTYAKKKTSDRYYKENDIQLTIIGVRKAEGGVRATAYKNCYSRETSHGVDQYRPLFWFSDEDRAWYEQAFGVQHSRCYTQYGFKRTGCAGCPFNRNLFDDLASCQAYEPQMVKAGKTIFKDSYEWTRGYRQFREMKDKGFIQEKMW